MGEDTEKRLSEASVAVAPRNPLTRKWNVEAHYSKERLPDWGGKAATILEQPKCWSSSSSTSAFHREQAQRPERVIRFVHNTTKHNKCNTSNHSKHHINTHNRRHHHKSPPQETDGRVDAGAHGGNVGGGLHVPVSGELPSGVADREFAANRTTLLKQGDLTRVTGATSVARQMDGSEMGTWWQGAGAGAGGAKSRHVPIVYGMYTASKVQHHQVAAPHRSSLNSYHIEVGTRSPIVFRRLFQGRSRASGRKKHKKKNGARRHMILRARPQIGDADDGTDEPNLATLQDEPASTTTGNTFAHESSMSGTSDSLVRSPVAGDLLVGRPGWKKTPTEVKVRDKLNKLSVDARLRNEFLATLEHTKAQARKSKSMKLHAGHKARRRRRTSTCTTTTTTTEGDLVQQTTGVDDDDNHDDDDAQQDIVRDMLVENKWLNDSKDECVQYWDTVQKLKREIDHSTTNTKKIALYKQWPSPPSPNHSSAHRRSKTRQRSAMLEQRAQRAAGQRREAESDRLERIEKAQKAKHGLTWGVALNKSQRERVEHSRLRLATLITFLSCSLKLGNSFQVNKDAREDLSKTAKSAIAIQRSWKRTKALAYGRQYRAAVLKVRRCVGVSLLSRRIQKKAESAGIIVSFLTHEVSDFIKVLKNYRFRVVQVQRYWRSYSAITRTRVRTMVLMFEGAERARLQRERNLAERKARDSVAELQQALETLVTDFGSRGGPRLSGASSTSGGARRRGTITSRRVSFVTGSDSSPRKRSSVMRCPPPVVSSGSRKSSVMMPSEPQPPPREDGRGDGNRRRSSNLLGGRPTRRSFITGGLSGLGYPGMQTDVNNANQRATDANVPNKIPHKMKKSLMASILRERRLEFRNGWNAWKVRRDRERNKSTLVSMDQVRQSITAHRRPKVEEESGAANNKARQPTPTTSSIRGPLPAGLAPSSSPLLARRGLRSGKKWGKEPLCEYPMLYIYTSFTRESLGDLLDVARSTVQEQTFNLGRLDGNSASGQGEDHTEEGTADAGAGGQERPL